MESDINKLRVKIFADGADLRLIESFRGLDFIKGFTTNPSLIRSAGVKDYEKYSKEIASKIEDKSLSIEVFADNFDLMIEQAKTISSWSKNIYAKIPIMNTNGEFSGPVIRELSLAGIPINITAIMTTKQLRASLNVINSDSKIIFSVFAGRIADTGRDPCDVMTECSNLLNGRYNSELLWASTREIYNIFQAEKTNCDIITVGYNLLSKVNLIGKDLNDYSRETVDSFYRDAKSTRLKILPDR
ncbi:MAG: transaldolase [Betaproteobacteria bacterium TMED82]|nr:MAG: transaldolase [Betaproteobacteria bacterium TMED82]|tara:strand:- start:129063 stop:129794 length:732 start_codon:yes stop_codon:yes gene_type:complete